VPRTTPSVPSNVRLYQTTSSSLTVTFEKPISNGGENVTMYKIVWDITPSCSSNSAWPLKGSATLSAREYSSYTITDLKPGVQIYVRLSAMNSKGYGPSIESTPPSLAPNLQKPGAPVLQHVSTTGKSITVMWDEPSMPYFQQPCSGTLANPKPCPPLGNVGGAAVNLYIVELVGKTDQQVTPAQKQTNFQHTFTNLQSGEYRVRIFARNSRGIGPHSKELKITVA